MKIRRSSTVAVIGIIAVATIVGLLIFSRGVIRSGAKDPELKSAPRGGPRSPKEMEDIERYNATPEFAKQAAFVMAQASGKILFFGRVVDHHGEPVPDAQVFYITSTAGQTMAMRHATTTETRTDASGRFKIEQNNGVALSVRDVRKDGYKFVTGGYVYSYGFGSSSAPHRPDINRPVQFLIIPSEFKMLSAIRPTGTGLRFTWNSGPIEVPIGQTGEVLILNPTREKREDERKGFAWKVEIEIRDGGLLMKDKGDLLPLAPQAGYQKKNVVGYERNAADWGSVLRDRQFVFKTANGKYGKFNLTIHADYEDGSAGTIVTFKLNPTGERYLD